MKAHDLGDNSCYIWRP